MRVLKLNTNAFVKIDEVSTLPFLLELQAKANQIASVDFLASGRETLAHLQKVDLTTNKITALPQIVANSLRSLVVDENEIAKIDFAGHLSLEILSMNKNQMTNCHGLASLKALTSLQMQEN